MPKHVPARYLHFCQLVHFLCRAYSASITSWWRTEQRNHDKGGLENSYHLEGLAADLEPDNPDDRDRLAIAARALDLDAAIEADHVHIEDDYRRNP